MVGAAGRAAAQDSPVLHAAIALTDELREASDRAEAGHRIPASIAAALKQAGVFAMAMPRAWGGPELDPLTQIRVIEALAIADGSVGWCAMIGCDGGFISGFLDQDVAREMFSDISVATAAAATTTGQAQRVPGGYRVGGRFPFVSGCHKAAGGGAVYRKGPLDRSLRDVLTMNQHIVGSLRTYEMAGRLLLGTAPLRWLF